MVPGAGSAEPSTVKGHALLSFFCHQLPQTQPFLAPYAPCADRQTSLPLAPQGTGPPRSSDSSGLSDFAGEASGGKTE